MIKPGAFHPTGWLRLLALVAIVLSGAVTLPANDSSAAPMSAATIGATQPQVLQVRDGCGRGLRFSERRGACVEDFDDAPGYDRGPPRDYDRRPPPVVYDRRPPAPEYYRERGPVAPDCGRGMRFSNSRQACVRIEGAVDDRDNNDVAAGALVGGVVGALVGSAIQNEANRQGPVQQRPAVSAQGVSNIRRP